MLLEAGSELFENPNDSIEQYRNAIMEIIQLLNHNPELYMEVLRVNRTHMINEIRAALVFLGYDTQENLIMVLKK